MQVGLPRSITRRTARAAIGLVTAAVALVAAPGVASASTTTSAYGGYDSGYGGYGGSTGYTGAVVVSPLLDCTTANRDGSYTAVLGYKNTSTATYTITGTYNQVTPSQYDGDQPTTFKPGTYHGVFSLRIPSGTVYWSLANTRLTISRTAAGTCAAGTTLPATGNGTGIALGLVAAGLVGVLVVRRVRRTQLRVAAAG